MNALKTTPHLMLCASLVQGCSMLAVHGPPDNHASLDHFDCTNEDVIPAQDMGLGVTAAATGLVAGLGIDSELRKEEAGVAVVVGGVGMALAIGSAIFGLVKTADCREARLQADVRATERTALRHQELLQALRALKQPDATAETATYTNVPGSAPTPAVPQVAPGWGKPAAQVE